MVKIFSKIEVFLMANFIVEFPLKTEIYQEDILNKRFEIGRQIYNSLVHITQKRYPEMIKTKNYRKLMASLTGNKKIDKEIWKQIHNIRKQYRFSEYSFQEDVKALQKHFKEHIDSSTAQKIATKLWTAYEDLFFGDGKKIWYKKYGEFHSLEGKSNATGIRFRENHILWNGLRIPVLIEENNPYEKEALQSKICYNRIVRKYVRNKYKFYVQIVFQGNPPIKTDKKTKERKHNIGCGDVGLDIGTSTLAIVSETKVKLLELADRVQSIEAQKQKLCRKMDRSRRAMNANNYNEDGTIKKDRNKKLEWKKSKHYKKYQNQLKEYYRKEAAIRKYQHESLANEVLVLGNKIYREKMNFKGLQRRAKKTEKRENGKFQSKKRFGKSFGNKAPSMFLTILNRKLKYYGEELIEINTYKARASQFNHIEESYKKKKLWERWSEVGGVRVQRDLYSAFLIQNIGEDLESFDMEKCRERFEKFKELHDKEVERLRGKKNLRSMGI